MKLGRKKLSDTQKVELVISNKTVVRVMIMVVLTILGLAALGKVADALVLIFIAFFLALALNAPVHWISQRLPGKRKGSRTLATSISFLIVVLVMAGIIALIVPPAVKQVTAFVKAAPELVENLRDKDTALGKLVHDNNLEETVSGLSDDVSEVAKQSTGSAVSTVGTVGATFVSLLTVLVMTFMMLVEGPRWIGYGKRLLENDNSNGRVEKNVTEMYKVVRGYVNGQVLLAFIAALMILPVMLLLNVPYAGALAPIVFLCGLIPMIGHYIGATVVTLVALSHSWVSALLILGFYILYQQIENYVVQPRVQASATNMSPLLVFASVIVGINLGGIIGGLVAIPVAGCIRVLLVDYLEAKGKISSSESKQILEDKKV